MRGAGLAVARTASAGRAGLMARAIIAVWREFGPRERVRWALAQVLDARACSHSLGKARGAGQAAAGIVRAGIGRLGGLYVAARRGPALD